jgi:AcrR family transcriptional regulator
MPTLTRRKRAIVRTREDILEAAAHAFSRRGFHSATMRDIAHEAGYTAASLYTYFKSKQEILDGLVRLVVEEFLTRFDDPLPAGLTFRQRLEVLTHRQLANAERRRALYAVLMTLGPKNGCGVRPAGRPTAKGGAKGRDEDNPFWPVEIQVERLAAWFRENAAPDDLGGYSPEIAARFMTSIAHGFLTNWVFAQPADAPVTDQARLILDLFFHGIGGASAASGANVP